jgi:hypothetical protein
MQPGVRLTGRTNNRLAAAAICQQPSLTSACSERAAGYAVLIEHFH